MGKNYKFAGNPGTTDKDESLGRVFIETADPITVDITAKSVFSNLLYDIKTALRIANTYHAEAQDEVIKEKDVEED